MLRLPPLLVLNSIHEDTLNVMRVMLNLKAIYNLPVDIMRVDPQAFQKNQKRHFFRDIEKSFQEFTPIGPEPHQFFSF